jgi:hypothetical protein
MDTCTFVGTVLTAAAVAVLAVDLDALVPATFGM